MPDEKILYTVDEKNLIPVLYTGKYNILIDTKENVKEFIDNYLKPNKDEQTD